jgi:hypothetical protein
MGACDVALDKLVRVFDAVERGGLAPGVGVVAALAAELHALREEHRALAARVADPEPMRAEIAAALAVVGYVMQDHTREHRDLLAEAQDLAANVEHRLLAAEQSYQDHLRALKPELEKLREILYGQREWQEEWDKLRAPQIPAPVTAFGRRFFDAAARRSSVIASDYEARILRFLAWRCGEDGVVLTTIEDIARAVWLSPKGDSTRRHLHTFESLGYLTVERAGVHGLRITLYLRAASPPEPPARH